jgi:PleD family two-component response regulator
MTVPCICLSILASKKAQSVTRLSTSSVFLQQLPDSLFHSGMQSSIHKSENEGRHGMGLMMQTHEDIHSSLQTNFPAGSRILIVSDDDSDTRQLRAMLSEGGFAFDCAKSLRAGCEAAKSGQFQVVISAPLLKDGSWRRLADIANHSDLRFEVVLWARNFDLREWAEALENGAFDVLDAVYEQSRVVEAANCALWAAYLKGAGPNPRVMRASRVA